MFSDITAAIMPLYQVTLEDAKQFINWIAKMGAKARFSPVVLSHPRMCMAIARDKEKVITYLPFQSCLMYDALAPNPDVTKKELATGIYQIGEEVEKAMKATGNCDAYAQVNDDGLAEAMLKTKKWEEVTNIRLMRRRIEAPKLPEA